MPTLGADCHIKLSHPAVDDGQPYGFILHAEDKERGAAVSIQRLVDSMGSVRVKIFFTVLLSDRLVNPDGSQHAASQATMYARLVQFLEKVDGLTLESTAGVITNVGASGHSATEMHHGGFSLVACQLNNAGPYFPPADPAVFFNSVWDGSLAWDGAYWR